MTAISGKSDEAKLGAYRNALENVNSQDQIAQALIKLGYEKPIIDVGRELLNETLKKYQLNQAENAERSMAFDQFKAFWIEMDKQYTYDRKRAKVIFRNEPGILQKLALVGSPPSSFEKWIQSVKIFYTELSNDKDLQQRVQRLKLSEEGIIKGKKNSEELEKARGNYMKEKGEAQDATQKKEEAFSKINEWMGEFYAVARIALEDNPQLLEALNKTVKN